MRPWVHLGQISLHHVHGDVTLAHESSTNYSAGFEIAPQIDVLRALDLQATYYSIKISNVLQPFNRLSSQDIADPNQPSALIFLGDCVFGLAEKFQRDRDLLR